MSYNGIEHSYKVIFDIDINGSQDLQEQLLEEEDSFSTWTVTLTTA